MSSILGYQEWHVNGGFHVPAPPVLMPVFDINPELTSSNSILESVRTYTINGIGFLPIDYLGERNQAFCVHAEFSHITGGMFNPIWGFYAPPPYMDITFSGLGGDFASYNGTNRVEFHKDGWLLSATDGLTWADSGTKPTLFVYWYNSPSNEKWIVWLMISTGSGSPPPACQKSWIRESHDPYGVYSEGSCDDYDCADGDTCYKSSGATCSVSEV